MEKEMVDNWGRTGLHYAAMHGCGIEEVIGHADCYKKDVYSKAPIDYCHDFQVRHIEEVEEEM